MRRLEVTPRDNWPRIVESQGFAFHTIGGRPYWDESVCYEFSADQVDEIEEAVTELHSMCLDAVEHVVNHRLFDRFDIPQEHWCYIEESWRNNEPSIYGRFDLSYDGVEPPKMLEYNADTPTSLVEAAVIQWHWLKDVWEDDDVDQFNSIHEKLIERWKEVRPQNQIPLYFASPGNDLEDDGNVGYLRDTAHQAGLETRWIALTDMGWTTWMHSFVDLEERPMRAIFKLYPWEWMIRDRFGPMLLETSPTWFEPPWKMILSNKAILPILWKLFPKSPYLLPAAFDLQGLGYNTKSYVSKPILAREGANITIVQNDNILASTDGIYHDGPRVYQALKALPNFQGNHPVIGAWVIGDQPAGIGIRESNELVTRNTSRFVPHLFRS